MSTGIKVRGKGNKVHDNTVVGTDVGYDIEGEDNDIKGNKYFFSIPRLKPLVAAIKNPRANNNEGWKIMIVGVLLAALLTVAGMVVYDFYVKPTLSKMLEQPLQTEAIKESK